ncbi:MAG: hypothetical protein EP343_14540 [Deltaproteobacteria bacterium]|nr:MAG: hypothetical protein EP343_14540 [Deltaproteobacteria bacterium]
MGAITLSFVYDPENNRRELWVDYESEDDWLTAEHERRHREIVKQLIAEGKLDPDMIDRVQVRVAGEERVVEQVPLDAVEQEDFAPSQGEAKAEPNKG